MSWISSTIHAAGNVVAPALEAAGAVESKIPGAKASSARLTNAGHAISNPNIVLSNPGQFSHGGISGFAAVPASAPHTSGSSGSHSAANKTGSTSTYDPQAAAQAAQTAKDNALYSQYGNEAHSALDDLLGQYNTALKSENSGYQTAQNEDQSAFNKQQGNYNQAVTGQNQDLLRQTNQDREGVSNAYTNLMNLLGAYGGGASSVALQWAPNAAKTYENKLMSGDQQTSAKNLASLASNWNDYTTGYDQQKQKQLDQHNQNLAQATQDYNATRGKLNNLLNTISNQSDTTGNIGTNLNNIEASIPNSVYVKPTYTGITEAFARPSLASFESQMPTASINPNVVPNSSSATPVLSYLLSQGQKKQGATAVAPQQKKTQVMV